MSADSPLKARITEDMKSAMRAGDKSRLGTIRMVLAAIKQVEVDTREALDESQVLAVLDKMVKQRRESIAQFRDAGRNDLAEGEERELDVIQSYMPEPLSEAEITAMIDAAVAETGATSIRDMGRVMGELKPRLQGRADMAVVSSRVKVRLG
jgi:uncharacterized protein